MKTLCTNCGGNILREEAMKYGDKYYCKECFNAQFYVCDDCGTIVYVNEISVVNRDRDNQRKVCRSCLSNYHLCNGCGEYVSDSEIWARDDEMTICNGCSRHYSMCEDCGAIVHDDYLYFCEADNREYCESCYNEHNYTYVNEYSYKPEPIFLGYSDENLYLGVELEVDCGNNRKRTTKEIYDCFEDVYMKYDGSLSNNGFEIVSHPATIEYHTNSLGWGRIMDICKENDYRSHDTSTCGLHVHLSREFLGIDETEQELNIAKLIILFDRWWDEYIVPFSRRNIDAITHWACKPSIECMSTDTEDEIFSKVKNYKAGGRYKSINLENEHTIEFRLFRGTLNFNTFIASLQFVVSITRFVKGIKLNDIFTVNWSDFLDCIEYSELKKYMRIRKLIKEEN